jgi:hypothetical protein
MGRRGLRLSASAGDLRGCEGGARSESDLLRAETTRSVLIRPRTVPLPATRNRPGTLFAMLATVGLGDITDKLVSLGVKKPGDLALVDETLKKRLALPPASRVKLEKLLSLVEPQASLSAGAGSKSTSLLPRSVSEDFLWSGSESTSLLPRSVSEDALWAAPVRALERNRLHQQVLAAASPDVCQRRRKTPAYGSTSPSAKAKNAAPFRCVVCPLYHSSKTCNAREHCYRAHCESEQVK